MHIEQKQWCESIKKNFSSFFEDVIVLDVGSLDINGNNRYLFDEKSRYIGVDVVPGLNVDIVSQCHKLTFPDKIFDVVMSTNALEHDIYFPKTLKKMFNLTRKGGLLFFQACSDGWYEHGTLKTTPHNSGTSRLDESWANYYKNINRKDIESNLDLTLFNLWKIETIGKDITFWGIKK